MDIESSSGNVSLIAGGVIDLSGPTLYPNVSSAGGNFTAMAAPGFSLIQNADILSDHRAIVLERGVPKLSERRAGSDGKGRHGDAAMAAALAYYASRADEGRIAYIPARDA